MHQALRNEFNNLKKLGTQKGIPLALIETQIENVVFISSGERLVCLAIAEDEIHNMLSCYRVDMKKWNWAEAEGFTLQDIPKDLTNEILIRFKTPTEYLKYLKLR